MGPSPVRSWYSLGRAVPLKGAAVLRVTLLEGKTPEEARAGPEIFVRCKIAARGSSDWHGLIRRQGP